MLGFDGFRSELILNGADQSALSSGSFQDLVNDIGRSGLTLRARKADDVHVGRRMPEVAGRHLGVYFSRIFNCDHGSISGLFDDFQDLLDLGKSFFFDEDHGRALCRGVTDVLVTVVSLTDHGDKRGRRRYFSRVQNDLVEITVFPADPCVFTFPKKIFCFHVPILYSIFR